MLFLSLSFDGVRLGGLTFEPDSDFGEEPLSTFESLLGDGSTDEDRDVRFGGLMLSLSFNFDDDRLGGLGRDSVCCLGVEPEVFLLPLFGDERADTEVVEFEREGAGVGASRGLVPSVEATRVGVEETPELGLAFFVEDMSIAFTFDDLLPSAVRGLSLCSSFSLCGVRCDDTARRT